MSYAGPASRGKRALEIPGAAPASTPSSDRSPGRVRPQPPSTSTRFYNARYARGRSAAFVAGVVLGAVVGAGVALLLAPQSGEDTRRDLIRKGRRATRRGHDTWDDLRDELRRVARRRWPRRERQAATSAS